ncbi:MAG: phosphate/phosphite/phosphonate ABC transporter substrate-binding protein [Gammaproteobacteria bacterium]|nr:phosphate/phosphite/phosphonate ABC transporter substrate-binding protein [Gammaproteobacteria bacterium]
MTYNLAISPDFKPELIPGWFIFNTWLQKQLGEGIHLEIHQDFKEQHDAIDKGMVDLIYANPFDVSQLVRDKGFIALVKPVCKPDEAIIACHNGVYDDVKGLPPNIKIAQTDTPDVNTIGMIMLEPADIDKDSAEIVHCDNFVVVAKHLMRGNADVGFFLADSFNELSALVKKELYPLVSSQIHMIHHAMLVSPKMAGQKDWLCELLTSMSQNDSGKSMLGEIGVTEFEMMSEEDAEFMIDLMDTLTT